MSDRGVDSQLKYLGVLSILIASVRVSRLASSSVP